MFYHNLFEFKIIRPFKRGFVMEKSVKTSWKKKMELKNERRNAREYEQEIKAAKQKLIEV